MNRIPCVAAFTLMSLAAAPWLHAQEATGSQSPAQSHPRAVFRNALLREGSAIVDMRARIENDAGRGVWKLILSDASASSETSRDLWLLPCTRLSEMVRLAQASPQQAVEFSVTGRIYVFRGRNYILVTHAPVIAGRMAEKNTEIVATEATSATLPASQNEAGQAPDDQSIDAMIRDVERATGPLTRSTAPEAPRLPPDRAVDASGRSGAVSPKHEKLIAEETSIINRRGKIMRDLAVHQTETRDASFTVASGAAAATEPAATSGWIFAFDADASGLSDPPMRLLPCLLVEKIEEYGKGAGHNSPILISGTVYVYNGQNYLLPSVYRIPYERRNISP